MASKSNGSPDAHSETGSVSAYVQPSTPPSLAELFLLCARVGLFSFGGGLTGWFYRELVVIRGWVTDEEFAGSHAIAQMLPGPSVANLVICLGEQLRGPRGALTCLVAVFIGPFFAVIGLSVLFDRATNIGLIQAASNGVAFTALGLMLIICLRGIRRAMKFPPALGVIAATAVAIGILHWPLVPVALAMSTIGVGMAWRRL